MNSPEPVRFLLVDDSRENLFALEALLRQEGLELLKATSAREALEILLVNEVALALVDVQMPEMDGFELAELMRGTERTRHIPIVFLTAGAFDERRRFRGYEAGAVDFLFKPIEAHVLCSKAQVFFDLHRQKQELRAIAEENARLLEDSRRSAAALKELNDLLEMRVQERSAELMAANVEMEGFTYSVAHDLRAPLRAISATSKMLIEELSEDIPPEAKELLERQSFNSAKLATLIDDLLRLSRIGRQELRPTEIDLSALAHEVTSEEGGEGVAVEIEPGLRAFGDPVLLKLVLSNLIGNAIKYSPDGGTVRVGQRSCRGNPIYFVSDEGIGFEMQYAEKLFRPFERLHRDVDYPGTGVGLANVKRIIERHRGRVWAESPGPGQGATFSFTLPLQLNWIEPRPPLEQERAVAVLGGGDPVLDRVSSKESSTRTRQ